MPIRVALNHKTDYHYDRPVTLSPQVVRLRPAPHCRTPILSYSLQGPARASISSTGSRTRTATTWPGWSSPSRRGSFAVEVDLVAEMTVINPFDFFLEPSAENYPFAYEPMLARELIPYLETRAGRARGSASWSRTLRRRDVRDGRLPGRAQPAAAAARSAT